MKQSKLPDVVRVLLIDDDEDDYLIIKRLLASMTSISSTLDWAPTSSEGIARIQKSEHDAYLVDYRIDNRTGVEVLYEINALERPEPFILLTGVGDQGIERKSLQMAASDYLIKKNLTSDSLARALYYALGRKEQEKQKIDQLKQINRTKDEFISIASHQLRTPATTVKQYVAMMLDELGGPLNDMQKKLLHKAYESNERQLTIINNLLKVAQIDSNTFTLAQTNINISQLVSDAVEDFRPTFTQSNQSIKSSIEKNATAYADDNAIRMVIDNLLENANKYSEPGACTRVSVVSSNGKITITIADNGVGVSEPERLFKKFSRVENKLSAQVNGTGIGLYWAQSIAKMHGGNLFYTPNTPAGSQFILELPTVK
jgi:two-component system, sensor histidine kinase and response regulator